MSVVSYGCPRTGDEVETAIQADRLTLQRMQSMQLTIWVWCPHCMAGHQINASEAKVQENAQLDPIAAR